MGPDFCGPPPAPLHPAWHAPLEPTIQVDHEMLSSWWLGFQDPVLNQLIDAAVAENLDLRESAVRIVEARAQRCVVRADLFPQFSQGNSFTHRKQAISGGFFAGLGSLPGGSIRPIWISGRWGWMAAGKSMCLAGYAAWWKPLTLILL